MFEIHYFLKYLYYIAFILNLIIFKYDSKSGKFHEYSKYLRLVCPLVVVTFFSLLLLFLNRERQAHKYAGHLDFSLYGYLLTIQTFEVNINMIIIYFVACTHGKLLLKLSDAGKTLLKKVERLHELIPKKKLATTRNIFGMIICDWVCIVAGSLIQFYCNYDFLSMLITNSIQVVLNVVINVFYASFVYSSHMYDTIKSKLEKILRDLKHIDDGKFSKHLRLIVINESIDEIDEIRKLVWEVTNFTNKIRSLTGVIFLWSFALIFMTTLNVVRIINSDILVLLMNEFLFYVSLL